VSRKGGEGGRRGGGRRRGKKVGEGKILGQRSPGQGKRVYFWFIPKTA
jgi:hypothetical protein